MAEFFSPNDYWTQSELKACNIKHFTAVIQTWWRKLLYFSLLVIFNRAEYYGARKDQPQRSGATLGAPSPARKYKTSLEMAENEGTR